MQWTLPHQCLLVLHLVNSNNFSAYIILKENKKHSNDEIAEEIKKKTKSLDCEVSVSSSSMDTTSLVVLV